MKLFLLLVLCAACAQAQRVYRAADFGIVPGSDLNVSPLVDKMISDIVADVQVSAGGSSDDRIVISFSGGVYHFHEDGSAEREYYISNHDQDNPKHVGIALEGFSRLTLDGQGATFVFHGRMLPVSLIGSEDCTLKNFSVDFENPHIAQVTVVDNFPEKGIVFQPAEWVRYSLTPDSLFRTEGEGWALCNNYGIAFNGSTRHIVPQTSDTYCPMEGAHLVSEGRILAPRWRNPLIVPGTVVALRGWGRPAPGLFLSHDRNTRVENVKVHYAEGMGLLAQLCENIDLDGFSVCLKGDDDPRFFTTQADATHFSSCKGRIVAANGLYEGMMDDAINVHGTYLKVVKRIDDFTLVGRYMHNQAWGFEWGRVRDRVQFIRSVTMETVGDENEITAVSPYDKDVVHGAKEFLISFLNPVDSAVSELEGVGIENLTWTPEVVFSNNIVRNNRARGALFSTPRKTVVENNLFDHTSGTAILLCGDCNGWFETGACHDVTIRNNRFVNALTNMFQFTNAVISIYPEIPDLQRQQKYFHSNITIEDNVFEMFDIPVLYAKSVDGLVFRRNVIIRNSDFEPFHPNKSRFLLERVTNVGISE